MKEAAEPQPGYDDASMEQKLVLSDLLKEIGWGEMPAAEDR